MDWLTLGGYGQYVWPAYGVSVLLLVLEPWLVRRATQQALRATDELDEEGSA